MDEENVMALTPKEGAGLGLIHVVNKQHYEGSCVLKNCTEQEFIDFVAQANADPEKPDYVVLSPKWFADVEEGNAVAEEEIDQLNATQDAINIFWDVLNAAGIPDEEIEARLTERERAEGSRLN